MGLALGGHVIVCGHGVVDTTDTKSTTSWWDKVEKSMWPQVGLTLYCRLAQNAVTRLLVKSVVLLQIPQHLWGRDALHLLCLRQCWAPSGTSTKSWWLSSRTSRLKRSSRRQAIWAHVVAMTLDAN